ncbi:hypothetical protein BC343_14435 [Mucilaginibacter pedocola]|uniref:BIG2 domain-containing protein n=1 Tax=Mucilaginibacter pedocola TaxID=1792845 RepID=A0A1S9P9P8_9SPHI|nr:MBG domain-containing protein [Mucilaginibacter pedocola]OOQ57308.1 hypothetical protein BC343_14435 [Mucilaginibacter pedocola]
MKDRGMAVYFTRTGVLYKWIQADTKTQSKKLPDNHPLKGIRPEETAVNIAYAQTQWLNSNPAVKVEADSAYTDISNYYQSGKLISGVKNYRRITYKNIYPNTDIVYYIKDNKLEYDVVLRPGSEIAKVKFAYSGDAPAEKASGKIKISNGLGTLTEAGPVAMVANKTIAASYSHSKNGVSFSLGDVEQPQDKTLVIDPSISWSTFYGGPSEDAATSTATDASGNVYLAGYTQSTSNIATPGSQQSGGGGVLNYDAMLVKFDANGNRLWATYYGGTSSDLAYGVTTDNDGNIIIAGYTQSNGMATAGTAQDALAGDYDAFVAKFSTNGTRIWATYYGGPINAFGIQSGEDAALAVTTDASGNIYFTGYTYSQNFPVKGAAPHQLALAGSYDAFVVKLNTAGAASFATYYGGTQDDAGRGIAVGGSQVYVTGYTNSPTKISTGGAQQTTYGGGGYWDAFLTAFSPTGLQQWGTYYGGNVYDDKGFGVAVDSEGSVYMTGSAATPGLGTIATVGSHKQSIGGNEDAFLAKFNSLGARQWGTYYGGTATDISSAISINASDDIFIGGNTKSTAGIGNAGFKNDYTPGGFPTTTDGWVARFKKDGTLQWGSYIGDAGDDAVNGLATSGNFVYMAGSTNSNTGFVTNAFQNAFGGGVSDGFLAKADITTVPVTLPVATNSSNIVFSNILGDQVTLTWTNGTGTARIVEVRTLDNNFPNPSDASIYPNNNNYPSGYPLDAATKIIYRGTGNSVTVTGLTMGTTYYFKVFDYTGTFEPQVVYIRDNTTGNPASVTTGKNAQTITFAGPVDKNYGNGEFSPATASSGLAVNYTSDNTAVITVVGGQLRIMGVGSANITATQPGDATYDAATAVTAVVNVNKATLAIKAGNAQRKYGEANPAFSIVAYSGFVYNEGENVITTPPVFTTAATATSPVAFYNIVPSGAAAANYNFVYQNGILEVTKATLTVRPDDKNRDQGQANPAFTLTYTGFVNGETAAALTTAPTATTTATTASAPGAYPITASGGVATNYDFVYQQGTLTIGVVLTAQSITFAPFADVFVDEADFFANGSASSGLPVTYSSSNTNVANIIPATGGQPAMVHLVGAGTTTITASQAGNDVYAPAADVSRTLTVNKHDQVFTFAPFADVTILDPDFFADGHTDSELPISYSSSNTAVATIVGGNMIHVVGLGSTIITASQAGDNIWNPAGPISRQLTVTKAPQQADLLPISAKTYGDADFEPTIIINEGGATVLSSSNPAVAIIMPDGKHIHIVGGGTATITATQPETDIYFAGPPSSQLLTVNKANQTITFPIFANHLVGEADFSVGASTTSGLPLIYTSSNTAVATVSASGMVHLLSEGFTNITVSQPGNANFNAAVSVEHTLNVFERQPQTIALAPFENEEVIATDFFAGGVATSGLKVTYTSSNPAVATIVTSSDPRGDLIHITGVGTTTITASQAGDAYWFPAPNVSQALTVVKAFQSVWIPPFALKIDFGSADFNPEASATSGLPVTLTSSNPAVATITADGKIHIVGAGTADITATQPGNSAYVAAAPFTQTLTISKAGQTITFAAIADKTLIDADFDPGATASSSLGVTYSSSNTSVATILAGKVHIVGLGTAKITATQLGNANYNAATPVQHDIVVAKASQTITFAAIADMRTQTTATLTATSSSGLPITLTVTGDKARLSGTTLTALTAGTVTVTATQAGNDTYLAAKPVERTFTIIQPPTVRPNNIITPNGDGYNDTWIIADIGSFPDCRIRIYDRAGREVYAFSGAYNNNWAGTNRSGDPLVQDAYLYKIDLGNGSTLSGTITIVRN